MQALAPYRSMTKIPASTVTVATLEAAPAVERVKLRGRPRKEQEAVIDADILGSAISLFGEMGFGGTSMEAVAARGGISKRTLYMRYPDKKALFKAVIDSIVTNARQPDPPAFADMPACLAFHLENFFLICDDPGMRVIFAMSENSVQSLPELAKLDQEFTQELGVRRIAATIADTADRAGLCVPDPAFYAAALLDLAMAHHKRVRTLMLPDDVARTKAVGQRIAALLLAGMQAEADAAIAAQGRRARA